jgi:hypothetical protein
MDFVQARELIRVRYELRTLLAQNRREEALPFLERLRALAASDEEESLALEPEIARWECGSASGGEAASVAARSAPPATG